MSKSDMVYVAADPLQPGAAYAICVDRPEYARETAKTIAQWVRRGANVMRVDHDTGVAMLGKWVRPSKCANPTAARGASVPDAG